MDNALQALLAMVKSALTCSKEPLPEDVSMEAVAPLAARHQVEGLAYDGALRCGMEKQTPAMRGLFQAYCRAAVISEVQMEKLQELYAAFDGAQIDYLPLKGCVMKEMYPKAELRAMNDADILIRVEQYDAIRPVMERLGYRFVAESDCELKWVTQGLYVELHKRLIPSFIKDFYAYFGDGWQLAHKQEGTKYALSAEDEFLFIFTHFARHYREGGVGIRHMADIWYYRLKTPSLDEEKIRSVLKQMSLDTFYTNILKTLEHWFEGGEETPVTRQITNYIAGSGSFGESETKAAADNLRKAGGKGRKGLILRALFPPLENMRYAYPVLRKQPVLLPVMWVYRGVKVALRNPERIREEKERLRNDQTDKMHDCEQSLRAVGLGMEYEEE